MLKGYYLLCIIFFMNQTLDLVYIRNILTIRYNPEEKPPITPAVWRDFNDSNIDNSGTKTQQLLIESTKKCIPYTKTPIIVSLSSGIDSSLSLAIVRKVFPDRKIVSVCGVFDENNNESKQAEKIASDFDSEFYTLNMPSIFVNMPEIISITRKPKWNTYTHLIAKKAKTFGNVLVTGDGADEIFGGYSFRYSKFLTLNHDSDNWKLKIKNYLECHNRDWIQNQEDLFGKSIKFNWNFIYSYFKKFFINPLEPLQQVILADFNGKLLHDFIPTGRSIAKYYDLNIFSPFLDANVIKFGLGLPLNQKFDVKTKKGKLTLRKISKKLQIKHIDEKKGFSPSLLIDWEENGRRVFEKYILNRNSHIFKKELINYNWVLNAYERFEEDGDIRILNRLISIMALEIWYKLIIKNEITNLTKLL